MANEWSALDTFWNSFGLNAYDENTVPDDAVFPYITYQASVSDLDQMITLTASLWYRSTTWTGIDRKAHDISEYIGGGAGVAYDGGRLWITKGSPFAQRMSDETDSAIRRIYLMIGAEFQ